VISLLQSIVSLYLSAGLGINRLIGEGPVRSTVREWIASFAYGAGELLFDLLLRGLMRAEPLGELPETAPPVHLHRAPSPSRTKRRRLERAARFWQLAEHPYAQAKFRLPRLHFNSAHLLSFVLHWLQGEGGSTPSLLVAALVHHADGLGRYAALASRDEPF
jgi:hypothetical protein